MFSNFLAGLRGSPGNDASEMRRSSPRRRSDRCIAMVCGQTCPVENWSFSGVLLGADERLFSSGQEIEIGLKFKLRNTIIDVMHHGTVVRKTSGKVAIQFEPLGKTIRHAFQQVIDDAVASEFATSQI